MSRKYYISDQNKPHFVTFTVIYWIDAFTRQEFRDIFLESVQYCQKNKGLKVYAWCFMSNHVHLILGTTGENKLEYIVRDLKSFTSRRYRELLEDSRFGESRRKWMYWMMTQAGVRNKNNRYFQFWQQHSHPIELSDNNMVDQRLEYIHNNPVKAGLVESPELWLYNSARDYFETGKGRLELEFIN